MQLPNQRQRAQTDNIESISSSVAQRHMPFSLPIPPTTLTNDAELNEPNEEQVVGNETASDEQSINDLSISKRGRKRSADTTTPSDEDSTKIRKISHNIAEKKRRDKINIKLAELRSFLPRCDEIVGRANNKAAILQQTLEYIHELQRFNMQLREEQYILLLQNQKLKLLKQSLLGSTVSPLPSSSSFSVNLPASASLLLSETKTNNESTQNAVGSENELNSEYKSRAGRRLSPGTPWISPSTSGTTRAVSSSPISDRETSPVPTPHVLPSVCSSSFSTQSPTSQQSCPTTSSPVCLLSSPSHSQLQSLPAITATTPIPSSSTTPFTPVSPAGGSSLSSLSFQQIPSLLSLPTATQSSPPPTTTLGQGAVSSPSNLSAFAGTNSEYSLWQQIQFLEVTRQSLRSSLRVPNVLGLDVGFGPSRSGTLPLTPRPPSESYLLPPANANANTNFNTNKNTNANFVGTSAE